MRHGNHYLRIVVLPLLFVKDNYAIFGMNEPYSSTRPVISPLLIMGVGILAVSSGAIFIRFAQTYAPSLTIAMYRMVLTSILLLPFTFPKHIPELRSLNKQALLLAFLSGAFLALHFATWITSLEYTSVASSVIFVDSTPIWVALLSPFLLKEKLSPLAWGGIAFAFLGGIVVALSDTCQLAFPQLWCPDFASFLAGKASIGNFLALVGAWAAAAYLMIGRHLRAKLSLTAYIFIVYSSAAVILLIITALAGQPVSGFPAIAYVWFFLLALIPQMIGHSSFNYALGYLPAAYVAVMLLGEPIGSTILAIFLLNEIPTPFKIFGGIFILLGIYLVSREQNSQ